MARVWIYGAGGHGRVVADAVLSAGHELAGYVDDDEARAGEAIHGVAIHTWDSCCAARAEGEQIALGVGDNTARAAVLDRVRAAGWSVMRVIHARAVISPTATIGEGAVVLACGQLCCDSRIGDGAVVYTGAVVEHDCVLGHCACLSPNAALGGGVHLGRRTFLGVGAIVIPLVQVGDDVVVGAGAVVIRDVPDGVTVVGVPARTLPPR